MLDNVTETLRNRGEYRQYSIIKITQNNKKRPGAWGNMLSLKILWKTIKEK